MGSVDPVRDREVIEFELALADLATVEKRLDRVKRSAKTGDKEALAELPVIEKAYEFLKEGRGLWEAKLSAEELALAQAALTPHRRSRSSTRPTSPTPSSRARKART